MSNSISTIIKKFYDEWNIQGFVLLSLSLQAILIMFAPFRKRTGSVIVILLIWLAYLLADWAANFAVGLISNSQKDYKKIPDDHSDILAFWAPFLLLHLGGPDSITAFALEDNALWLRHLVGLLSQVVAALIVFGQSFPRNKLWVPTVLLFVTGAIKYGERTCALFLANLNRFRESMLKEPIQRSSRTEAQLPILIELIPEPIQESNIGTYGADESMLDDLTAVKYAYSLFKIFDGLIVDLIFSFRDRDDSRLFFRQTCAEDAIKVLAVQLNFIYELLYTKVAVVHSRFGYFVRFISWCAVVAALSTFYSLDKHGFRKIDVGITYTLIFGAICLDTIALFMLAFSDWTIASILQLSRDNICIAPIKRCFLPLLKYFLALKRINWRTDTKSTNACLEWARQILFRRWSESLHQYNLIDYCLKEYPKENLTPFDYFGRILIIYVIEELCLKDFYDWMKYVSKKPLTKELWGFIFKELKKKSTLADDPDTAKRICSARGEWVLQNWINESRKLMHYIVDFEFDESLILWHIATELCYDKEIYEVDNSREFCKILSDYMLYLLVMQPTMMSAVAGIALKRFHDTCIEAKKIFCKNINQGQKQQACTRILEQNVAPKRDISKSVLFDACILAEELRKLERHKRWKLMSEVWVELLSYAASHCRANGHAAQLSKGGELVTFVWLLMAHFGIGNQYQIAESPPSAKLIVGK